MASPRDAAATRRPANIPAQKRERAIEIHPLTRDRWRDLNALFSRDRTTSGCWCMWFRTSEPEFRANYGAGNRVALKRIVDAEPAPGVLAYVDGQPAGWCAVAPREQYPRVLRSRATKPIDEAPAWAITCLFVDANARGLGVARRLIGAAVAYARANGARLIEGYPVDTTERRVTDDAAYHGTLALFQAAGFREVARRTPARPIVRLEVRAPRDVARRPR